MELTDVRAFLAVIDAGSLSRAAARTGIARTTLRRRLEALEQATGAVLVDRGGDGVVLTEAGEVMALRGRILLAESHALTTAVQEVHRGVQGPVRIAVPPGAPPLLLQALSQTVRTRHPHLALHLLVRENPLGWLADDFDIALHIGKQQLGGPWAQELLAEVKVCLVASEGYLNRRGVPDSPAALADHDLLAWSAPGWNSLVVHAPGGVDVPVAPYVTSPDILWLRDSAMRGLGIAYVPDAGIPDPPGSTPLVPVLPNAVRGAIAVQAVVPRMVQEVPRIRVVIEIIRAIMAWLPESA